MSEKKKILPHSVRGNGKSGEFREIKSDPAPPRGSQDRRFLGSKQKGVQSGNPPRPPKKS